MKHPLEVVGDNNSRPTVLEIGQESFVKITWGVIGAASSVLVASVLWMSSVDSKTTESVGRLSQQQEAIKEMQDHIIDIDKRTIRIETILNEVKRRF